MSDRAFVLGVSILPLSMILISDLGIAPTEWYFFAFILYYNEERSTYIFVAQPGHINPDPMTAFFKSN